MRARGFTLVEVLIVIAMIAIIATVAVPSLGAAAERGRLKAAAETLAADLAEARFESARLGRALSVEPHADGRWCWAVSASSRCDCRSPATACLMKASRDSDFAGVLMADAATARFDPTGTVLSTGGATFRSTRGEALKVDLSPAGRGRICSVGGAVYGYPAC